jgi:lysophospholipase L1-like esterase
MPPFKYYIYGAHPETAVAPSSGKPFFAPVPAFNSDPPSGFSFIKADDPSIYYIGRFASGASDRPVFVWQGSQLCARFSGRRIGFRFDSVIGRNYYNVIIDGENRLLGLEEGPGTDYLANFEIEPGEHELVLYKRSEAYFGSAVFQGLILEKGACLGPRPETLPLRIEFYGDSITAGACNEDPGDDQYEDLSSHDNYLSYGSIACRMLNAEYISIAVSGTGLTCSWNPILMPEIWDRTAPDPVSPKHDFSGPPPDIVVVNLGQNDVGFPASQGRPLSGDFAQRYVSFIRGIRAVYPRSFIVCTIGGMTAYRDSAELRAAWSCAMGALRGGDDRILELRFEAFSYSHPRIPVHRALAAELASFIRTEILGHSTIGDRRVEASVRI